MRITLYCTVNEWPRLQSSQEKPHWLRVDFEHWEDLSNGSGEEEEREGGEGEGKEKGDKKALASAKIAEIKEQQVTKLWPKLKQK